MMKRVPLSCVFLFLLLLSSLSGKAQRDGRVVSTDGDGVAFANVVTLNGSDSTFAGGTITDEQGGFCADSIGSGQILKVSSVGFKTLWRRMDANLSHIVLERDSNVLDEVTVTSSLPRTILSNEGAVTIVAGSVLERSFDIDHLLDRIPLVSAQKGDITVIGRGTPLVYINGRKMVNKMQLDRLHPEDVLSVEVIRTPGAKYDKSAKCVIRIKTKDGAQDGLGVETVSELDVNRKKRASADENLQLSYHKGAWDIYGVLYGCYRHSQDDKSQREQTFLQDEWQLTNDIDQEYTHAVLNSWVGASYQCGENSSLGAGVAYERMAKMDGTGDFSTSLLRNGVLAEDGTSHYESPGDKKAVRTNTYYTGKLGNVRIDVNGDFFWSVMHEADRVDERYTSSASEITRQTVATSLTTSNRLGAARLAMSLPVWDGSLVCGGEYSATVRKSRYDIVPAGLTDEEDSRYQEDMTTAFAEYNRSFGSLNFQAGLRYERVDFRYYDHGEYVGAQSRVLGNWFPSAALSFPVGNVQMQLVYSSDISRPSYGDLRGSVQYDNQYTYQTGNPFLVPNINRNMSYGLSWNWLYASFVYTHNSDVICSLAKTYQDDPRKTLFRPENLEGFDNVQASLAVQPSFGVWHLSVSLQVYKQWLKMDVRDSRRTRAPYAWMKMTNIVELPWLTITSNLVYQTKGSLFNTYRCNNYVYADLQLTKRLLHNKLFLQLDIADLFGTDALETEVYSGRQHVTFSKPKACGYVEVSVRYRFNVSDKHYNGTGAGESQKNRM